MLCVTIISLVASWLGVTKGLRDFAAQSGETHLRDAQIALDEAVAQRHKHQALASRPAVESAALREILRMPPSLRAEDAARSEVHKLTLPTPGTLFVLRDSEDRLVTSSSGAAPRELTLDRAELLDEIEGSRLGIASVGDQLSIVTETDILEDGRVLGRLAACEALSYRVADQLSRACGADLAILVRDQLVACAGSIAERELSAEQVGDLAAVHDEASAETLTIEGIELYATAKPLSKNARIVLSQSADALSDLHDALRAWLLPTAIVLLLGTLILTRIVARRLTMPIAALARIANVIAGGALDTEVPKNARTAEIARLQDAFHGMTARLRDVLEDVQNKNEALATQRDELARANRAKSNFLATASHELRTPISSIRSFSEILLAGDADDEPEETREEFLDIIRSESVRLARLVEQLLDLATIESGVASWQNEKLDLGEVAQRTLRALEGFAQAREVDLELRNPTRSYPYLGDADRLQQTILNLVGNAVKFSPKGGTVAVTIQRDSFGYQLFIDDQGPGVPEEERGRIFEKFVQSEDILTDKPQGSGLGLAIVREIVQVHGGRVRCDEAPGGGARFVVRLPEPHPMRPLERFISEAEAAKESTTSRS